MNKAHVPRWYQKNVTTDGDVEIDRGEITIDYVNTSEDI